MEFDAKKYFFAETHILCDAEHHTKQLQYLSQRYKLVENYI